MSSAATGSRLWPVLSVLAGLLALSAALELYARTRQLSGVVVAIHAPVVGNLGDGDESLDDDPEADSSAAIDAEHEKARELGRRGDVDGALSILEQKTAASPDIALLHADVGYYRLIAGAPAEAAKSLSRARELGSQSPVTYLNLAIALRRTGELTGAEQAIHRSLELRPTFRAAKLVLATILGAQRRWDEAATVLVELTQTGGNAARATALLSLGRVQLAQGLPEGAQRSFDKAIEWMPAQADVRIAAARTYLIAGGAPNVARGLAMAESAVTLAPDLAIAHSMLGRAQEAAGDSQAAEVSFDSALRLDPNLHYARRRLLRIALRRRDDDKARAHAERLLALSPGNSEHHFLAGLAAAHAGRTDDARSHYLAAIDAAKGNYPEACFNLGLLEKDAGKLDAAAAAYARAIESKPDYLAAWNNLGLLHVAKSEDDRAEQAYRKALSIDVRYVPAWANLGKLALRRKRYDDAIAAFQRAAALRPGSQEALLNLGVAYRRAGRVDDAVATYQKLVAAEPRYVSAWYNLGIALAHAKKLGEARAAYERALSLDDTHLPSLRNLAELLVQGGDLEAARARYESLLDQKPDDRPARVALADVFRRAGNAAACTQTLGPVLPRAEADGATLSARCRARGEGQRLSL